MKKYLMVVLVIFLIIPCFSQDSLAPGGIANFSSSLYPSGKQELENILIKTFNDAPPLENKSSINAIIVPHATYKLSGKIAASSFNQIDPGKVYDNIFILASSHTSLFSGASIDKDSVYKTPLGTININYDLVNKLLEESSIFNYTPAAHAIEHGIQAQLPFIQHYFKNQIPIVPIVIGSQDIVTCRKIADILKLYFNENNLFIISSNFSYHPSYEDAYIIDSITANAIVTGIPDLVIETLKENLQKGIENLSSCLSGWTAVLTLMYLTEGNNYDYHHINYSNSGDSENGDKSMVVGYHSIVVEKKKENKTLENNIQNLHFTMEEQGMLLNLAKKAIADYIVKGEAGSNLDVNTLSSQLLYPYGAFVTLNKNGSLRGNMGRFNPDKPLYKVIQEMAIAAATKDSRFPTVTREELIEIDIEISVLTPLKKIKSINEIQLGKHGIYIKDGFNGGSFLPQVSIENEWTIEEFLGHCSRDEVGIGWYGWKEAEIFVYEAIIFNENQFNSFKNK
ncbi:MAG: AmmeMemoRadiSam system protein B [bacterium]